MSDLSITLPEKTLLLNKLLQVSDTATLRMHFYPELLKKAGSRVTPVELVLTFTAGLNACMPYYTDTALRVLFANLPHYVRKFSGSNLRFAVEARRLIAQVKMNL